MSFPEKLTLFSAEDIQNTQPAMKVGLLASVTSDGLPHVTLLSSLMACGPNQLCFGQFTEGKSKKHILTNPKTGFLIMGLDKNLWRGKAMYSHFARSGQEFDYYNNVPMFRYNAYFGIHTVYYLDLVEQTGRLPLPMNKIVASALLSMLARALGRKPNPIQPVLNPWTRNFLNKIDNLKFLSFIGTDGYPTIIPAIQTQSLDRRHLVFSTSVYTDELKFIPAGADMAVFCMALTMEDVLLRGKYLGINRLGGVKTGLIELNWVYNPMPPVPGQVYPPVAIHPITEF
jgi:hypothetical protein